MTIISASRDSISTDRAAANRSDGPTKPGVKRASFTYYADCAGGVQPVASRIAVVKVCVGDLIRRGWKNRAVSRAGQGGSAIAIFGH
jgi:hypothetical protein